MAYIRKVKNYYYGYYKQKNGKYKSISLKTSDVSQAKRRLKDLEKLEYEISIGLVSGPTQLESVPKNTLGKLIAKYMSRSTTSYSGCF